MIPQGWQPIGEPDIPELSPDAKRVRDYITENRIAQITYKTESAMCRALHMGIDRLQDAVYEFRKWEAIMARRPKIDKEQRAEMLRLHNEERYSVGKLASKYGCSQTAVKTALQAAKIEAEGEIMQNTGINAEFEQAVDQMIEEAEAPAEAVQEQPAVLEPVYTDKLPPVVLRAIRYSLIDMESEIESREERIAELQIEIAEFRKDIDALKAWREAHT